MQVKVQKIFLIFSFRVLTSENKDFSSVIGEIPKFSTSVSEHLRILGFNFAPIPVYGIKSKNVVQRPTISFAAKDKNGISQGNLSVEPSSLRLFPRNITDQCKFFSYRIKCVKIIEKSWIIVPSKKPRNRLLFTWLFLLLNDWQCKAQPPSKDIFLTFLILIFYGFVPLAFSLMVDVMCLESRNDVYDLLFCSFI